jgi:hypothetical protein
MLVISPGWRFFLQVFIIFESSFKLCIGRFQMAQLGTIFLGWFTGYFLVLHISNLYVCIYRKFKIQRVARMRSYTMLKLNFQVKNDRSDSFNLFFISNSCRKSNFIFFEKKLLFFCVRRRWSLLDDPKSLNQATFSWPKKIAKKFQKI